ncbi:guanine deaminase [Dongia deserti]|uniref:guanine deaminase n=1 Tax=Dongia deserti TaxID=2268030 RepID=UPI000E653B47|nr:guanine deaminase [Dongia deserti]
MTTTTYLRGSILHFLRDPGAPADPEAWEYWEDGCLKIIDGHIGAVGPADETLKTRAAQDALHDHRGKLILPGFIDTHVHYAQVDVIASYGRQLLDWLNDYTFPAERAFADPDHARRIASLFLDTLLRHGTTTAAVYPTVHKQSVDAFFEEAQRRRLRMICGKVLMDRNSPDYLRDDVHDAEADCRELIQRWHGKDRLGYALTPRFAPTSSREQLAMAGRLYAETGVWMQTHLAENADEIRWVKELFPEARSYLDVYDRFRLLGPRSVFAHCIHLDTEDRARFVASNSAMSFCPTSNLFIGSGFFDLEAARSLGVRVGLATDVGGGTSYSMLQTLAEAYKVLMTHGQRLNAWRGLWLATLGGAECLSLDDTIGNFAIGKEADCVVLDLAATPVLDRRMQVATALEERLFALMMLGDDRTVAATYVLGERRI